MTDELMHFGRSKKDGAKKGSGRYPYGSGEDPRAYKRDHPNASDDKKVKYESDNRAKSEAKARKQAQKYLNKQAKALKKQKKYEIRLEKAVAKAEKERAKRDKKFINQGRGEIDKLTNDELRERTARANLEKDYINAVNAARAKKDGIVKRALKDAFSIALKGGAATAMVIGGKEVLARMMKSSVDWRDDEGSIDPKKIWREINQNMNKYAK